MDYKKALSILGLKTGFTEDDLKQSYRRLSKIYHPDKYQEGNELYYQMTIKQQEINAAREHLKNHLKKNNSHNNNIFNLDHYKQQK